MNKYNKNLVTIVANHYQIARSEAEQYLDLMEQNEIIDLLQKYGKQEKQIKELLKWRQ